MKIWKQLLISAAALPICGGALLGAAAAPSHPECDFNGDGNVSMADAVLLMRFISEDTQLASDLELSSIDWGVADLDNDGIITILDVSMLLGILNQDIPPEMTTTTTTATTTATTKPTTTTAAPVVTEAPRTEPPVQQDDYRQSWNGNTPYGVYYNAYKDTDWVVYAISNGDGTTTLYTKEYRCSDGSSTTTSAPMSRITVRDDFVDDFMNTWQFLYNELENASDEVTSHFERGQANTFSMTVAWYNIVAKGSRGYANAGDKSGVQLVWYEPGDEDVEQNIGTPHEIKFGFWYITYSNDDWDTYYVLNWGALH